MYVSLIAEQFDLTVLNPAMECLGHESGNAC